MRFRIRAGVTVLLTAITLVPLESAGWAAPARPDGTAATVAHAAPADSAADWNAIKDFLPSLNGKWTAPPTKPVTDYFSNGPLLGNGDLGAVVGGDTHSETFYLSKNDFWNNSSANGVRPIPLGGLTLRTASGNDSSTTYSQTQDLLNAEVRSDLTINGAPIHTRTYPSDTGDFLITEVTTSGTSPVTLDLDVWTKADNPVYPASSGVSGSTLWASRETQKDDGSQWVARAAVATRVLGATATTSTNSAGKSTAEFTVEPRKTVTVVSSVNGGKNATTHVADAQTAVAGVDAAKVASISAAHQAWWKAYWLKSYVRVYDSEVEKFYYGGQYVLGSSARTGSNAPGLWGNWITTDTAAWHGDYHLNYNVEAPYYGAFSSNRPELADPYIQTILDYRSAGAANIKKLRSITTSDGVSQEFKNAVPANARGYLYPVAIGPWGSTVEYNWWNQPSDASYAATPMIYRYEYTPDRTYLRRTLYPYLVQLAGFWEDYLGPKGSDGKYHLMGSAYEGDWTHDDSIDLGAINLVLKSALKYSKILNVDSSRRAAWQNIVDNLPPYATATYNGATVFNSDYDTDFSSLINRTVCNVEWIHPFDDLTLDSSPEQRQAAINTLNAMNSWTEGNNFAKSFGIAARVGYPAAGLFAQLKSVIHSYMQPNLSIYQSGGGLETAGTTDAVNAMLLQSINGTIRLFPDYPAGQKAHFSRLRTQGGFLVSADYDGTNASNVSLTADNAGGPVTVLNPWPGRTMTVTDSTGARVATNQSNDGYTFTTTAGATYTLTPSGDTTGASLTGSVAKQPAGTVDLAAQGTRDWAHWGLTNAAGFDHKAGVTPAISNLEQVGGNSVLQLTDSPVTYSWTRGTPTASAAATPTGVFTRSVANGFQITVPASTTPQRLRIYLGAWSAKGKLTASLSDHSATTYTGYLDSPSGNGYGLADLTFSAASAGQTLTVTYLGETSYSGTDGNITLHAAILTNAAAA
ncbi:hypothetical protein GCM10029978_063210 [Actinoallomurus acanthiterrae]